MYVTVISFVPCQSIIFQIVEYFPCLSNRLYMLETPGFNRVTDPHPHQCFFSLPAGISKKKIG